MVIVSGKKRNLFMSHNLKHSCTDLVLSGRQNCVVLVITRTLADLWWSLLPPSSSEQVHSPECCDLRYFTVKMLFSEPS